MKKTLYFLIIASLILSLSSCASTKRRDLFNEAPIALISIISHFDINWKGEEPITSPSSGEAFRRILGAEEDWVTITRANLIIDEAEEIIRRNLENSPFITFAPQVDVFRSHSYNEAQLNPFIESDDLITPAGYRMIFHRDNDFFPAFARETGIQRSLFITLDMTKDMSSGFSKNGNLRADVSMIVMLKDERGRTLFNQTFNARSRMQTRVTSGAYDQDHLLELTRSAINDACMDFLDTL